VSAVARATLTPLREDDLPRIADWLVRPHVRRWYETTPEKIRGYLSADWIAPFLLRLDAVPVGYCQLYRPHDYAASTHPYCDLPHGALGLDMFIGEADLIGRGLGGRFLAAIAERARAEGRPCLFADLAPDNASAIRAYRKAGLEDHGECETPWGRVLLLVRRLERSCNL